MKKKNEGRNNALLNLISPIGLNFQKNTATIGENTGKIYGLVRYPTQPDYGWLSKITNIPGTIASFHFKPVNNADFIDALNRNITNERAIQNSTKDTLSRQRAKKSADDGEKLLESIDQNGEPVGMLSTTVMPFANDQIAFEKVRRKAVSTLTASKCKVRLLSDLQHRAFKHMSPMYTTDEYVKQVTIRPVPLSAVMGGFANSSSGFNDGSGYYVAKDASGGLVILDFWLRSNDRTNTNFALLGIQGQGKSTAIKHIAISEYMKGTKIIITDPQGEYRHTCKKLGGDWINAGGGENGRINPLQIRATPKDDDDEDEKLRVYTDEGHGMGDMALYIKHLEVFFSIYLPELDAVEKAILKSTLIELYNEFKIYWDTDINILKPEDFPIMEDLYNLLLKKAAEKEKTRKGNDSNIYDKLSILLEDAAKGSDSALWNGYTTIDPKSRFICLVTKDLQNAPDNIKCAQYFNINSWKWKLMTEDPTDPVLSLYDEAYLMIDNKVPQSLAFLRNGIKSSRKFEAGIGVISHSVVDFLDPSVKMYGQALLDSPCYKIIFGADGQNLKEISSLYNLTGAEEELLSSKQRGHALMMIGSKRLHVNFDIPEYKFEYIGTAGGR